MLPLGECFTQHTKKPALCVGGACGLGGEQEGQRVAERVSVSERREAAQPTAIANTGTSAGGFRSDVLKYYLHECFLWRWGFLGHSLPRRHRLTMIHHHCNQDRNFPH
jgi:hypothetical protein